jgi:hypothetical protein
LNIQLDFCLAIQPNAILKGANEEGILSIIMTDVFDAVPQFVSN